MDDRVWSMIIWLVAGILVGCLGSLVGGGSVWIYGFSGVLGAILVGFLVRWSRLAETATSGLAVDGAAAILGAVIGVIVWIFVG